MKKIFSRTAAAFLTMLLIFACFGASSALLPVLYCAVLFLVFRAEKTRNFREDALAALCFIGGFIIAEWLTDICADLLAASFNSYGNVFDAILEPIVTHTVHLVFCAALLLLLTKFLRIERASLLKVLPFAWIVVVLGALLQAALAALLTNLAPGPVLDDTVFGIYNVMSGADSGSRVSDLAYNLIPACELYFIAVFLRGRNPARAD